MACRTCKDYPNTPVEGFEFLDEHPKFPVAEWAKLVSENETRQGYWQHVREKLQEEIAREPLNRKKKAQEEAAAKEVAAAPAGETNEQATQGLAQQT